MEQYVKSVHELEKMTGKTFSLPSEQPAPKSPPKRKVEEKEEIPLLLSVRSGSAASMPGDDRTGVLYSCSLFFYGLHFLHLLKIYLQPSPLSSPLHCTGMMDTVLNLGVNRERVEMMARVSHNPRW